MIRRLNIRHLLALVTLALAGALVLVVLRNYRTPTPEEIISSLPRDVDLSLREINYTETRDGVRRWTLVADSAAHTVGEGLTRIENVRMTFHGVDGQGDILLTAKEGVLTSETRQVEVSGDVVIRSPRGYVLYTDSLEYRERDRQIRTDDPVRAVSDAMEVTGRGLRLDVQNQHLVLLADVKAQWSGAQGGG